MRQIMKHVSILWMGQRNPPVENGGKHPIIYSWLVVWNIFYFSFHIWDVILPIDELYHFSRWAHCTTNQIMPESPSPIEVLLKFYELVAIIPLFISFQHVSSIHILSHYVSIIPLTHIIPLFRGFQPPIL